MADGGAALSGRRASPRSRRYMYWRHAIFGCRWTTTAQRGCKFLRAVARGESENFAPNLEMAAWPDQAFLGHGKSPNTVSWLVEPTNTFPFTTSGVMNFAPTGSVSRAPAWLLLYNSMPRL